jgi:UDP-glucuronate 4-epimerase
MAILVTGAAGFIGSHVAGRLLSRGDTVIGVDNLNAYYDVRLKEARLARLTGHPRFSFHRVDIADREGFNAALAPHAGDITAAIHLAAQAGVRHSIDHPFDYISANILGHLVVLEWCRHRPGFGHLVYASSSSVYGGNTKLPFSVEDRVDQPISLYAATKKADELMSHTYSHLYRIPQTGLRFFTVYGPWGRPDMALFKFCRAILDNQPITIFNDGHMRRDFTFIDDIVEGIVAVADRQPAGPGVPAKVYNIGNHRSEPLVRFISVIEEALGIKAEIIYEAMQAGDVKETFADIQPLTDDFGFHPKTSIDEGIPKFVRWYRDFYKV